MKHLTYLQYSYFRQYLRELSVFIPKPTETNKYSVWENVKFCNIKSGDKYMFASVS
jgi:hypothetical protein